MITQEQLNAATERIRRVYPDAIIVKCVDHKHRDHLLSIWVEWGRFYDRICGNGWMYERSKGFCSDHYYHPDTPFVEVSEVLLARLNAWITEQLPP